MSRLAYPTPYRILTIIVCIPAAVIGGFLGLFTHGTTGLYVAGIGGILAGLFWSYRMLLCTRKGLQRSKLADRGIFWGIVVGIADTLLLHSVGIIVAILTRPISGEDAGPLAVTVFALLLVGILCGSVAGGVNGWFWGLIWKAVAKKYPLSTTTQE